MDIKVTFDNITVKEDKIDTVVKILMLKGEKGDQGDGENNVIEEVQVNGTALPVSNKAVNVPVPTVDSALNSTSENPVQNKVIHNALNGKVNNSDLNNYYQISEIDDLLNGKANISDLDNFYEKSEVDNLINNKADASDVGDIDNLTTTDKTSVVNAINELNAPQKWVSVGATAPTDGRRVWFANSKNLFNSNVEIKNGFVSNPNSIGQVVAYGNSSATYSFVNCCKVEQGKTYTISWTQSETSASVNTRVGCIVDNNNIVEQQVSTWIDSQIYITFTASVDGFLILCTDINATNIQVEEGTTVTTYEPYTEQGIYIDGELWISK